MDPFVAEIRIFPFNFAPKDWAFCDGQLMPISQFTALFSLLGTTYGGDGRTTFALPNMQGNAPMHPGQGTGLSLHDLGETGGSGKVQLLVAELPSHAHPLLADPTSSNLTAPTAVRSLARAAPGFAYSASTANMKPMSSNAIAPAGGDQPHSNMQPYLTLNFCIALTGVFPPR